MTDKGFEGEDRHLQWEDAYGAVVVCAPKGSTQKRRWPKTLRRWVASIRQIVETANERLQGTFRLDSERPHALGGGVPPDWSRHLERLR